MKPNHQPRVLILTKQSTSTMAEVVTTAVAVLKAGGIVIYPTETVYGIGVDATNPQAVAKLLKYKSRREGKPLSIAVTDQAMAEKFVELNDQARSLYRRFLPGPVTVVSRDLGRVAPGVASEFGTLGIRQPAHPLILALVQTLGRPITATSANASGEKRPYSLNDILSRLSNQQIKLIDLAIDAGTLPPNPPSTVIDTTLSTPLVMRQGAALMETAATMPTLASFTSSSPLETRQIAGKWLLKYWDQLKATGLVIGLNGSLGAGKTVLTQGIGEFLQISEPIVSPTYTYLLEYPYRRHSQTGKLYHVDAWKIADAAQLAELQLAKLVQPGSILVIEWWNQIASDLTKGEDLSLAAPILTIDLKIINPKTRQLEIKIIRPGI